MAKKNEPIEARAWDAVKADEDPTFFNTTPTHQGELRARAADVVATGVTVNPFEAKVKELHQTDREDAPQTALGTTNNIGEEPPKAKAKAAAKEESGEQSLESMRRAELDELAKEKGLNPEDYSNKAEIIAALEK